MPTPNEFVVLKSVNISVDGQKKAINWYECSTKEELQKIGSLDFVVELISKDLGNAVSIIAEDWEQILSLTNNIRSLLNRDDDREVEYFKTSTDRLIFCLTELDGRDRQKLLNVSPLHYRSIKIANDWKKKIAQKIHTDRCKHPKASEAWDVMQKMFAEMVASAK